MAINPQVTARVVPVVRDRIDRCVDAANEVNPASPMDRGDMVRALILRALPQVEAEFGLDAMAPKRRTNTTKKKPARSRSTPTKKKRSTRGRAR